MRFYTLIVPVFLLLIFQSINAQNQRLISMGGLDLSIMDQDNSLNLYDFGRNPAWLYSDENNSWLKINPVFTDIKGDYKRKYDFGSENLYHLGFTGVKTLGTKGTFLGYTSYSINDRIGVNRSLKLNPYAGEAFFMTDTTMGNFKYDGPKVGFMYSFELLPDLFAGASVEYQILQGLKNTYSRAQTLYRGVGGSAGLAYRFSDALIVGADLNLFDTQESIEAKSDEGTDVEIFNFRGETYFIKDRAAASTQKIRKQGESFSCQLYMNPFVDFEIAIKGKYSESDTKILLAKPQIKEYEDGYAGFENIGVELKSRYEVTPDFRLGFTLFNFSDDSWSKNTIRDLLLWKWNMKETGAGIGASYFFSTLDLLIGAEFEMSKIDADSSKYIDGRFNTITTNGNLLKIGSELSITQKMVLRAGYNYGTDKYDVVYGGEDVRSSQISFGLGYTYNEKAAMNISFIYKNILPGNFDNMFRSNLAVQAELKLLSF